MATFELYGMQMSAPCRSVGMTLEATGTPYDFKVVNLFEGEQMKPEFLKVRTAVKQVFLLVITITETSEVGSLALT